MARGSTVEEPKADPNPFGAAIGSAAEGVPAPNSKKARGSKAAKPPKVAKPSRRERKASKKPGAVTNVATAKQVEAKQKEMSLGTRYNGDRKKYAAFGAALALIPAISLTAIVIAVNRPSEQMVSDLISERLAAEGTQFPAGEAVAWAGSVIQTWGNWDEADESGLREANLAQFLSQGMDSRAGWNGKGKQAINYIAVNPSPVVQDDSRALVNATYQTDVGVWRCVTLSVYSYKPDGFSQASPNAFALSANPTPVACAPRTGAPALNDTEVSGYGDDATELADQLTSQFFPGFFAAWAASDAATLGQYVTTDTTLIGLGGAFESSPLPIITSVGLPTPLTAEGQPRTDDPEAPWVSTVGVTWTLPGTATQIASTYKVDLRKMGNQWQVTGEPEPIVQQPGLNGTPSVGTSTDETVTFGGSSGSTTSPGLDGR